MDRNKMKNEHDLFDELVDLCGGDGEIHILAHEILTEWNKQPDQIPGSLTEIARRRGWPKHPLSEW